MIARYQLRKDNKMIEHHSKAWLVWFRATYRPLFYRAKIRHIIQAYPDKVKEGYVYDINTGEEVTR